MIAVATVSVFQVTATVNEIDDDEVVVCAMYTGPTRLLRDIIVTFDTESGSAIGKPVIALCSNQQVFQLILIIKSCILS